MPHTLPLHINIERETLDNPFYRWVIYTSADSQTALMNLPEGADVSKEVHSGDQFIRIEAGTGVAIVDGVSYELSNGVSLDIPAHSKHYIKNTGTENLKLYSKYCPPADSPTRIEIWDPVNRKAVILRD